MEQKFKASVQYNALRGSAAADRADVISPSKWLSGKELIDEGEHVIGISMYVGENHGGHRDPVYVSFLVSELKGYSNIPEMIGSINGPVPVRKIDVEMNVTDFFSLFKRFSIAISINGMLDGESYKTE